MDYYKKEEFSPYYESFINDLFGLLRIPSVLDKFDKDNLEAPFGSSIRESLDYMEKLAKRDGFSYTNVDNYAGFIDYGEGDKILLILCHLDVVPATGDWTNPPFDPIIKDGYIYARGSSDDKGPLMSLYYALKYLKDNDYKPKLKIRFFFGCDEESGSRGLERYIEKYGKDIECGFSPDADYPCIHAEKGISSEVIEGKINDDRLTEFKSGTVSNIVPDVATAKVNYDINETEFNSFLKENNLTGKLDKNQLTIFGKSAHGSVPEKGTNAALYLGKFLNKYIKNEFTDLISNVLFDDFYGEKCGISFKDNEMGQVSNNAAIYNLENGNYKIVLNIRYPKRYDLDSNISKFNDVLKPYNASIKVLSNSLPHYVPKYSHLVQALLKAYQKHTNDFSEAFSIGGGTYARDFDNAVAFGAQFPNAKDTMHMKDECAKIDDLIKSSFIYQDAIKNLCD